MAFKTRMALTSLSLFLGMFFFFSGIIKLSSLFHVEIHREIRRNYVRYSKAIPLFSSGYFGWKFSAKTYRQFVGYSELIGGLILALWPGKLKQFINIYFILLCTGGIYVHWTIGDDISKMLPVIVICLMLILRLLCHLLRRFDENTNDKVKTFSFEDKRQDFDQDQSQQQPQHLDNNQDLDYRMADESGFYELGTSSFDNSTSSNSSNGGSGGGGGKFHNNNNRIKKRSGTGRGGLRIGASGAGGIGTNERISNRRKSKSSKGKTMRFHQQQQQQQQQRDHQIQEI